MTEHATRKPVQNQGNVPEMVLRGDPGSLDELEGLLGDLEGGALPPAAPVVTMTVAAAAVEPEDALSGDFETVEDVLSDVFEDVAAFVEPTSAMDAPILSRAEEIARPLEQVAQPVPAPVAAVVEVPAPAPAPMPAVAPAPTPAPPPAPATAPPPVVEVPAPAPAPLPRRPGLLARLCTLLVPLLVAILSRLNYPLRVLPPGLRPLADWLALTLLFWVPIVWAIAMWLV